MIGATYQKNTYGPTPLEFQSIVEQMAKDKEIEHFQRSYYRYSQKRYLPLRNADLDKLTARETKLIDDVLNRLSDMGGKEISEYSHNDIPWLTTEDGAKIEYEAVFYRTPEYSVRGYEDEDEVSDGDKAS